MCFQSHKPTEARAQSLACFPLAAPLQDRAGQGRKNYFTLQNKIFAQSLRIDKLAASKGQMQSCKHFQFASLQFLIENISSRYFSHFGQGIEARTTVQVD